MRAAVLCLTNADRKARRLQPLRENARLRSAAVSHTADLVRGGFFAHTAPDGDTFVDRVLGAGYVLRNEGWTLGENLAWGTGELSTPRGI